MARISIVIPNFNGAEHLEVCLTSIRCQTMTDHEVIVVDNGSTDRSIEIVQGWNAAVRMIRLSENKGFAAAVNEGIRHASGNYIALVNNDIELDPRWLEELSSRLEARPELGSVASKMINFYDRNLIDAAGDILTSAGNVVGRGTGMKDAGQFDREELIFGACAGAGMYRKEIFTSTGLFDEDYFAWFEDADHSFRSQMSGWKCLYVPTAVCYHKRGATARRMSAFAARLHARNHFYCLFINLPASFVRSRFHLILASRLRNWFLISMHGDSGALWWAFLQIAQHRTMLFEKRRSVQAARTVPADYLESLIQQ